MKELVKRAKCLVGLIAIFVMIVTYLCIFEPVERSLFETEINGYEYLSLSRYKHVENEFLHYEDFSEKLSAQPPLLDKLISYYSGEVTLQELADFTQPNYEQAISEFKNIIVSAKRTADGEVIASYFNLDYCTCLADSDTYSSTNIPVEFITLDDFVFLKIVTDVHTEDAIYANDVLLFDFTEFLQGLTLDDVSVEIIFIEDYLSIADSEEVVEIQNDIIIYEGSKNISAISAQIGNAYVLVTTDKENFYTGINEIVLRVIFTWILILIFIFVILYLFFFRAAKIKFQTSEKSMGELKNELNRDKLTNAYSRGFLEVWNRKKRISSKLYTIAMLDIDNFKNVNDKYGHLVGDEVLKDVADVISNSIRTNDFIIRYGGDEFLILLNETYREDANIIIYRAQEKVKNIDKYGFQISFSYGLCELYLYDDLSKALETADTNMYINKRNSKEG